MPRKGKLPSSCVSCKHHRVQPDPDPLDSFCHDDVKVFCLLAKRDSTVACRPYNTRKETTPIPDWCPLADAVSVIAQLG